MFRYSAKNIFIHILLFILAIFTTTLAGAELLSGKFWLGWGMYPEDMLLSWADFSSGIPYSIAFLTFLTFHEFGHYFTAVYHRVNSSLPYYIPIFIPLPILNIGSFGAVIRLKQIPDTTRKYFDIGIAGPLAGFVVSTWLLIYGFSHLPPMESYLLERQPEYQELFGRVPTEAQLREYVETDPGLSEEEDAVAYYVGTSLLFEMLKRTIPDDPSQVPSHFDMLHYPLLFVGYLTLFFTALNLLPMGQLDGGHILYGMFGRKTSGIIARVSVVVLLLLGGTGLMALPAYPGWELLSPLLNIAFVFYVFRRMFGPKRKRDIIYASLVLILVQTILKWQFSEIEPNLIWLIYTWMVIRFVGVDHPPAYIEHRVNLPRQILGWVAILIFILCFTPTPLSVVGMQG